MPSRFEPDDPEATDRPQPGTARDPEDARDLNRTIGAWRIVGHVFRPHFRAGRALRIADLCTGTGDLPRCLAELARRSGVRLEIDAVEADESALTIARRRCEEFPEVRFHHADARDWCPGGRPPDWAVCALALHRFDRGDAVRLLERMRAMASGGALAADRERTWWTTAGWLAASLCTRRPGAAGDLRMSARAALTFGGLRELAAEAGWPSVAIHRRFFFGRQAIWYCNTAPAVDLDDAGPMPVPA